MSAWLPGLGLDWGRLIRLILVLARGSVRSSQHQAISSEQSAVSSQRLSAGRAEECLSDALTPVQSSPAAIMAEAACECERARVIIIHSCGGTCIHVLDITFYMYIQPHTGTHTQ